MPALRTNHKAPTDQTATRARSMNCSGTSPQRGEDYSVGARPKGAIDDRLCYSGRWCSGDTTVTRTLARHLTGLPRAVAGGLGLSAVAPGATKKLASPITDENERYIQEVAQHLRNSGKTSRATFGGDRKSTRLNSSHLGISYAVFC